MNVTDSNPAPERLQPIGGRVVRPLSDRVLVRRIVDDEGRGVIALPETAQRLSRRGVVVAVGPGKRHAEGHHIPLDVKPGDLVEFGRFTDYDDGELVLIQEADVVGIVTE